MPLKLRTREIPLVKFRRVLPEFLGPGGECFFEVDARAGGLVNIAYAAGRERVILAAKVMDRGYWEEKDDATWVAANDAAKRQGIRDMIGVM